MTVGPSAMSCNSSIASIDLAVSYFEGTPRNHSFITGILIVCHEHLMLNLMTASAGFMNYWGYPNYS